MMEESFSPEKILWRLEELRKWQKLQEQHLLVQQDLQRQEFAEKQAKAFEKLDLSDGLYHYSNSNPGSRNNSRLHYEEDDTNSEDNSLSRNLASIDYLTKGVSPLNISKESEPQHLQTPQNETLEYSCSYSNENLQCTTNINNIKIPTVNNNKSMKIVLDDVPILPPARDFKMLIEENLKSENNTNVTENVKNRGESRAYLRRGEGMSRFNMTKKDIGLNKKTKLPWLKQKINIKSKKSTDKLTTQHCLVNVEKDNNSECLTDLTPKSKKKLNFQAVPSLEAETIHTSELIKPETRIAIERLFAANEKIEQSPAPKVTKTWASVFSDEQEHYLKLLKRTNFYQNYQEHFDGQDMSDASLLMSPSFKGASLEKESAEQNMFELLENKVNNSSFCSTSSFYAKVIGSCSGRDTPSVNRDYIKANPRVLSIKPSLKELSNEDNCYHSVESLNEKAEDGCKVVQHDREDTEYTESTDTEDSCQINKFITTSTPNQGIDLQIVSKKYKELNEKKIRIVIENNEETQDSVTKNDIETNEWHSENDNLKREHLEQENDDTMKERDITSKTELLKVKLEELQAEIEIFRRENQAIEDFKKQIDKEREDFLKERAEVEKKNSEDKIISEYYLAEEKEKLAKQKLLYDRHVKEMKGKSIKKDMEEISFLKKEVFDLKEQMATRESRTGAAQARLRNQVKNVEKENGELKEECEKLKKENRRLTNLCERKRRLSNIKSLEEINRTLAQFTIENKMTDVEIEGIYPNDNQSNVTLSKSAYEKARRVKPTVLKHNVRSRSKSVPNLTTSRYAKYFSKRDEELKLTEARELGYGLNSDSESDGTLNSDFEIRDDKSRYSLPSRVANTDEVLSCRKYEKINVQCKREPQKILESLSKPKQFPKHQIVEENDVEEIYHSKFKSKPIDDQVKPVNIPYIDVHSKSVTSQPLINRAESTYCKPTSNSVQQEVQAESIRPDGSKEIQFKNGNKKYLSADGSYSKFVYFNGDVKETFYNEGTVKYFYKEMNTYHTTYRDGSQVIQFPDGHLERRYVDGSVEAHLPGGATRWSRPDGSEEWRFQDGIVVMVNTKGEQILRFPNGQTEIHTKDHKRREFPDGTVKVLYADGMAETRYANGRIRVKDKHGHLIMDSGGNAHTK